MHICPNGWTWLLWKKINKSYDITALRQLYDECEIQIRRLESAGIHCDSYGSLLCPILMQLIPNDIALSYTWKAGTNDVWSVPEFMAFLQLEVQSRERAVLQSLPSSVCVWTKQRKPRNFWHEFRYCGFICIKYSNYQIKRIKHSVAADS